MQFEENCLYVNWIKLVRGAGDRNILLIGIDTGLVIGYSLSGELVEGLAAELTS